jgi:hypothetical protein
VVAAVREAERAEAEAAERQRAAEAAARAQASLQVSPRALGQAAQGFAEGRARG